MSESVKQEIQSSLFDSEALSQTASAGETVPVPRFPATRYQGSKRKMLGDLKKRFEEMEFRTALDLYSGTGSVTLLLRLLGKSVASNDYLLFNQSCARLFQSLTPKDLARANRKDLAWLIHEAPLHATPIVAEQFESVFFLSEENEQIDRFCQNISQFNGALRDLYTYAFGQALLKKRPYNLFHRANLGMRTKDVKRSFGNAKTWETAALEHAKRAIDELKKFPFQVNPQFPEVYGVNTLVVDNLPRSFDVVYLDPPYLNGKGQGVDYSDFYGFLDGLCDYSLFSACDVGYPHKPVHKQPSSWLKTDSALWELDKIGEHYGRSTLVMSYRSDGQPSLQEIVGVLKKGGREVDLYTLGGYKYALSQSVTSDECIIVARA